MGPGVPGPNRGPENESDVYMYINIYMYNFIILTITSVYSVYSFVSNGPSSFSYNIDTGSNLIGFSFSFLNSENFDKASIL